MTHARWKKVVSALVGLILVFMLSPNGAAAEETGAQWPELHGSMTNETALRTASTSRLTKVKNILRLSTIYSVNENITVHLAGRFFYDAVFDLTDHYSDRVRKDQEDEADFREAFLHASFGNVDLKLGRQQIVWGEAVGGLFVADVVNPKDLREFILPDPAEMRIPLWAANMEYFLRGTYVQAIWIPVLDYNELPVQGSEFEQTLSRPEGVPFTVRSTKEPDRTLKNSGLGFRLSRMIGGWDLGVFYLYTYDAFPAPFRRVEAPQGFPPTVMIEPEHRRLNIFGTTFSKALGNDILRGEFVLNKGRYFAADDPADRDGVVKEDSLDYLLSLDHTFWGRVDCNVQWLQRIILDADPPTTDRQVESFVSLWLQTGFWDNRVQPEIFVITGLNQADLMVRPKITYHWAGHWRAALGADLFEGSSDGDFGQYDAKDRVYVELGYHF